MLHHRRSRIAALLTAVLLSCTACRAAGCGAMDLPAESSAELSEAETTVLTAETAPPPETTAETTASSVPETTTAPVPAEDASASPYLTAAKAASLRAKADDAARLSPDFVGWIYVPDSQISYPIMQGEDNDFYLHSDPDGGYDRLGSIFLDYRCSRDFSDPVNFIFGHNMASGKMFGSIRSFRSRSAFAAHRYGWLFTPDKVYRIDFFALCIVSAYDTIYYLPGSQEDFMARTRETVHFSADVMLAEEDRILSLSTCASDFADARALLSGKLVEMTAEADYISG